MERFQSTYDLPIGQAYGIIEAGLPCINRGTEGLAPESVGRPVPGYDVAAFSEDGAPVPVGTAGEIGVRGDGLFSAYYAPWVLREQMTPNGWFLTGDIGTLGEDGALVLKGRKKAVIFVAGLKFFPEEVEACINRFPGVRESRVFGTPHPHLGQVPEAEVVLDEPAADLNALRAHCAQALSPYKVPLQFTVVEATAKSPGGKLRRRPVPGVRRGRVMRVAILGAGPAGSALAILLARLGAKVTLFDDGRRRSSWSASRWSPRSSRSSGASAWRRRRRTAVT